jgi:hypothetical protein
MEEQTIRSADALRPRNERLSYEAETRIVRYLKDGDADNADSLHRDVQRLYNEMLAWRSTCQSWTPGGSEYRDLDYTREFIRERRQETHKLRCEVQRLKRALEATEPPPSPNHINTAERG